jgi:hypothetical protein
MHTAPRFFTQLFIQILEPDPKPDLLEMLDPDSMNPDPQHRCENFSTKL